MFIFFPQAVADIIRTTLGPRSMLKMLLDAGGGMPKALLVVYALHCWTKVNTNHFVLNNFGGW